MKKILVLSLLTSVLLFAETSTEQKIADKKAQISELETSVASLESTLPKDNSFVTHTEFGFIDTSGNTDTTAYNLDLTLKKSWGKHNFNFLADAQYADDSGVETNNKFLTELQYDYDINDKLAFTYLVGYKNDKFSGYNYQAYTGPGAKYKAIEEEKHQLTLEGNILYSQDELELLKQTEDYASVRAKGTYEWQIFENLTFTQDLSYRVQADEMDNYFVYSKTAFTSKLSDIFSLGISYKVDYANMPPALAEHSDKTLTMNLIVDY